VYLGEDGSSRRNLASGEWWSDDGTSKFWNWFPNCGQNLRSLMAWGRSGSLMSLICCGIFIFLTADTARAGAAEIPA